MSASLDESSKLLAKIRGMSEDQASAKIGDSRLPVIDLSLDDKVVAHNLRQACIGTGFFYVTNHGVTEVEISDVFQRAKAFFALPEASKLQCTGEAGTNRGYNGFLAETLNPAKQTQGGSKESYHIGQEHRPASSDPPTVQTMLDAQVQSDNRWPDTQLVPDFRDSMLAYFDRMCKVGERLMKLVALALGMEPGYFQPFLTNHASTLRLLHYDTTKSSVEQGVYACGEHSDYGLLTLLLTDEVPGLEIERQDGSWLIVQPMQGAFIVNIGDMLQRWTNDLFLSTVHRVVNSSGLERYSIPFFFDTNLHDMIECLPTCCSLSKPAKYPPITYGQHLASKIKAAYSTS